MKEVKKNTVSSSKKFALFLGISVLIIGVPLGIATIIVNQKVNNVAFFSKKENFVLTEDSKKLLKYLDNFKKIDQSHNIENQNILFSYDFSKFKYFNDLQKTFDDQFISSYDFNQFLSQKFFWQQYHVHQKNNDFIKQLDHQKNLEFFIDSLKINSPFQSDQISKIFDQSIIDEFGENIKKNLSKSFLPLQSDSVARAVEKVENKKTILQQIFIEESWKNLLPKHFDSVNINDSFVQFLQIYFEIFYDFFVSDTTINLDHFNSYWKQNFNERSWELKDLFNKLNIDLNIDLESKINRKDKKWSSFFNQNLKNIYGQIKISELQDVFVPYFSNPNFFISNDDEIKEKVKQNFLLLMEKYHFSKDLDHLDNFSSNIFANINTFLKKCKTIYQFTFKDYINIIESTLETEETNIYLLKTKDIFENFDTFNTKLKNYFSFQKLKNWFNTEDVLIQKKYLKIQSFAFLLKKILELKDSNSIYFVKNFWGSSQWFHHLFNLMFNHIYQNILINDKQNDIDTLNNKEKYQKNEFLDFLQTFFKSWTFSELQDFISQDLQRLTTQLNDIIIKSWSSTSSISNDQIFTKNLQDFFILKENADILKKLFNRFNKNSQKVINDQNLFNKLQEHHGFLESLVKFIKKDFLLTNNLSAKSLKNFILRNDKSLFLENDDFKNLNKIDSNLISKFLFYYFDLQKDQELKTQALKLKHFKIIAQIILTNLNFNNFYLNDKFIDQIYHFFESGQFFKAILKKEFRSLIPFGKTNEFFDVYQPPKLSEQISNVFVDQKLVLKLQKIKPIDLVHAFHRNLKIKEKKNAIQKILFNVLDQQQNDLNDQLIQKIDTLKDIIFNFIKNENIFLPPSNYKNDQKSFYDLIFDVNDQKTFNKINEIIFYKTKSFESINKLEQLLLLFLNNVKLTKEDLTKEDLSFITSQFQLLIDRKLEVKKEDLDSIAEKWLYDANLKLKHGNFGYKLETLEQMLLSNVDVFKFKVFFESKEYKNRFQEIESVWKNQILKWLQIDESKLKKNSIIYQLSDKVRNIIKYFSQNRSGDNTFSYVETFKEHFKDFSTSNQWKNNVNTFIFEQKNTKVNQIIDIFKKNDDLKIIENKIFDYLEKNNLQNNLFFTSLNSSLKSVIFDYFNHLKVYKMTPILDKLMINFKIKKQELYYYSPLTRKEIQTILNKNKWLSTYQEFLANKIDQNILNIPIEEKD